MIEVNLNKGAVEQFMGKPLLEVNYGETTVSMFDSTLACDFKKQYDTKITYAFKVAGMKIKCEEKFVNKTKEASLIFTGKGKILDVELSFYKEVPINTDIYEKYEWKVKNGILYVTLLEKINEKPPIFKHNLTEKDVNGIKN